MIRSKFSFIIMVLGILLQVTAAAQQYKHSAVLNPVNADGFYRISLYADVLGHCNTDLTDIRILDTKKQQIPYLVEETNSQARKDTSIALSVIAKTLDTARNSVVIVENLRGKAVTYLEITVKATSVIRNAKLSGSNDQKNWYIINDDMVLHPISNRWNSVIKFGNEIPLSNYRYLKITILNNEDEPYEVLSVATLLHKEDIHPVAYKEQIVTSFKPVFASGYSTITLIFEDPIPVEKLQLNIGYPKYYQRSVTLMTSEDTGKTLTEVTTGTVTSFGNNAIHFNMIKSRYLQLSVRNDDNPPLSISSISLGYMPGYIVAYLEKGKAYTLKFGNDYLTAPNYDLSVFKDKIPHNMENVAYKQVKATSAVQKSVIKKDTSAWWMWGSLCAALAVLGYFTFRLMRDMKKNG